MPGGAGQALLGVLGRDLQHLQRVTIAAEVDSVQAEGKITLIGGSVPLFSMFGYSTAVRSLSQGRGEFSMEPTGYRLVGEAELMDRGLT